MTLKGIDLLFNNRMEEFRTRLVCMFKQQFSVFFFFFEICLGKKVYENAHNVI